jgi:hypothetical protein
MAHQTSSKRSIPSKTASELLNEMNVIFIGGKVLN